MVKYISPALGVDGGHVCWLSPFTHPGPVLWVGLTPWELAQPGAEGLEIKAPGVWNERFCLLFSTGRPNSPQCLLAGMSIGTGRKQ